MYEQSKQEYVKYEPNASYPPTLGYAPNPGDAPPPSGYVPVQPYPYASYPPYRRRNRRMIVLLMLAAFIVAALMFAAIASTTMRGRFGGPDFAQAAPLGSGAMMKACNSNDVKCIAVPGFSQPIAPLGKPNAPTSKPCDPSDSACTANPQSDDAPILPDGVDCSPCLWTSSPDYQANGSDGNVSGAYHVYNLESLGSDVDAAIKHDLAAGWSLNVEVGSHDRALVFTDLGMVCEANDQCHQIGKLDPTLITRGSIPDFLTREYTGGLGVQPPDGAALLMLIVKRGS